jgi:hypothetical protein
MSRPSGKITSSKWRRSRRLGFVFPTSVVFPRTHSPTHAHTCHARDILTHVCHLPHVYRSHPGSSSRSKTSLTCGKPTGSRGTQRRAPRRLKRFTRKPSTSCRWLPLPQRDISAPVVVVGEDRALVADLPWLSRRDLGTTGSRSNGRTRRWTTTCLPRLRPPQASPLRSNLEGNESSESPGLLRLAAERPVLFKGVATSRTSSLSLRTRQQSPPPRQRRL